MEPVGLLTMNPVVLKRLEYEAGLLMEDEGDDATSTEFD